MFGSRAASRSARSCGSARARSNGLFSIPVAVSRIAIRRITSGRSRRRRAGLARVDEELAKENPFQPQRVRRTATAKPQRARRTQRNGGTAEQQTFLSYFLPFFLSFFLSFL